MAVSCTFGTNLPTVGPGLSAFIRYMEYPSVRGRIAIIKTRIPMPPPQWVKQRQNSTLLYIRSMASPLRMLAPVVVKPETVSNTAST